MQRFLSAAAEAQEQDLTPERHANSIVAGGALSLEGLQACSSPHCMADTVDQLILSTWHHFERVVLTGLDPRRAIEIVDFERTRTDAADRLFRHLHVALYVREVGAEDIFYFQRPERLCVYHLDEHAHEAGLVSAVDAADELERELSRGYDLRIQETRTGQKYAFKHPALTYISTGRVKKRMSRDALGRDIARKQARGLTSRLIRDAKLARDAKASLGQLTSVNSRVLTPSTHPVSSAEVAFNVELPVVRGLTAKELLMLRLEEAEEFAVFRAALKKAIEERIKALPSEDAKGVADSVVHDIVEPALADLRRRVTASQTLFGRRTEATLLAGGLVTTVGLLTFAPIVVPGLVIAAGGVVSGVSDFFKDQRDARMSDLHFLWKVSDMAAGRH